MEKNTEVVGDIAEGAGELVAQVIKAPVRFIGGFLDGLFG